MKIETPNKYDSDFAGWAFEQAALLRGMPELNNSGLDIDNIAEEIEDLGRSETNKISSLMCQAMVHLLKIVVDPESPSRQHMQQEVGSFVVSLRRSWSPGYRQRIDIDDIWKDAIEEAANALEAFDVEIPTMPDACPFDLEKFIEKGFNTRAAIERLQAALLEQTP